MSVRSISSVAIAGGGIVAWSAAAAIRREDYTAPAYWKADVSQAQLTHDVTMLIDEG